MTGRKPLGKDQLRSRSCLIDGSHLNALRYDEQVLALLKQFDSKQPVDLFAITLKVLLFPATAIQADCVLY